MAANSGLSSAQGRRPRILRLFQVTDFCRSAVSSSIVRLYSAIIHAGQRIQQSVVGFLRNFGSPMQVGDSFAQGPPLQIVLRSSFFGPEYPEITYRVDRRLGSSQHTTDLAVRLVVKLG